jgi:DNA-binding NarL/FixJ family response regulator
MLKTLVVDDNDEFRRSLVEILYRYFPAIDVVEAVCGRDARQKMKTFIPNLVFMDIRLPDENGLVIGKQFKSHYPAIDIVVMSSFDLPEYRNAAVKMGAKYFLAKESLSEDIYYLLKNIMGQTHSKLN